jgi:hypothetical protein
MACPWRGSASIRGHILYADRAEIEKPPQGTIAASAPKQGRLCSRHFARNGVTQPEVTERLYEEGPAEVLPIGEPRDQYDREIGAALNCLFGKLELGIGMSEISIRGDGSSVSKACACWPSSA